jgi:protein-S-isoprenylcysteine O-methyltransferase Ste14
MFIRFSQFLPWYGLFLTFVVVERVISTFFQKVHRPSKAIYHKWIFYLLLLFYILIGIIAILEFILKTPQINLMLVLAGIVIFCGGVFLRRRAISALGDHWSNYTEIKENQKVVTGGVYRFLAHPYYLAVLMELAGISLISHATFAIVLVFIIQAPLLLLRISLEERMLVGSFGDGYRNYRERVF